MRGLLIAEVAGALTPGGPFGSFALVYALGKIGASLASIEEGQTPLQQRTGRVVGMLALVAIAMALTALPTPFHQRVVLIQQEILSWRAGTATASRRRRAAPIPTAVCGSITSPVDSRTSPMMRSVSVSSNRAARNTGEIQCSY